jgi:hypothetical protein
LFFRFADDSQSRAVFDAATGVEIFQLGKNISGASGDDAAEFKKGSAAYELGDVIRYAQ